MNIPGERYMTDIKVPEIDLDASLKRLAEWLALRRDNQIDYAEDSRRYNGLAKRLRGIAAVLEGQEWSFLESEFDKDPPPMIGEDGMKIPSPDSNASRYKILVSRLLELAETAGRMADEIPSPQAKPELSLAADFFLHLWLAAGNERPKMYDKGAAVTALRRVLSDAKYELSPERVRGILSDAWNKFDPYFCLDQWQLDRFIVYRQ
jgi:hypothetical protein